MNVADVKAAVARTSSMTTPDKLAFQAALIKDHEDIITMEQLKANFATMEKPVRRAIYIRLEEEVKKYPGLVPYSTHSAAAAFAGKPTPEGANESLLATPYLMLRAKVEMFRGLKRGQDGKLIRDEAWKAKRADYLQRKAAINDRRNQRIAAKLADLGVKND